MSINLVSFPLFHSSLLFLSFTNSHSFLFVVSPGAGNIFMTANHQDILPSVFEEVHSFDSNINTAETTSSTFYVQEEITIAPLLTKHALPKALAGRLGHTGGNAFD